MSAMRELFRMAGPGCGRSTQRTESARRSYGMPSAVSRTVTRSDALRSMMRTSSTRRTLVTRPCVCARSVSPSTASSCSRVQRVVQLKRLDVEQ
jgi:hypothetical protein